MVQLGLTDGCKACENIRIRQMLAHAKRVAATVRGFGGPYIRTGTGTVRYGVLLLLLAGTGGWARMTI